MYEPNFSDGFIQFGVGMYFLISLMIYKSFTFWIGWASAAVTRAVTLSQLILKIVMCRLMMQMMKMMIYTNPIST